MSFCAHAGMVRPILILTNCLASLSAALLLMLAWLIFWTSLFLFLIP